MTLTPAELARYSRHLSLPEVGVGGQQRLKSARVLIVGAGGLGSPAALYLAAAGIGTLGIIDGDKVDVSNLQRQILFDSASIGQSKAQLARTRLAALNSEINVIAHAVDLSAANARDVLSGYDYVLDGSDRLSTRYLVNDACVLFGKSLVSAAIHRFEGQAMTYVPGKGPCYRCLFSNAEGVAANCAEAGVLGVLPGLMGSLQATEVIKLITGIGAPLIGRLLTYDALNMHFSEFRFKRRVDCAVCGDQPSIIELRDAPAAAAAPASGVRSYSAAELRAALGALTLVDVREADEFASGHIVGSLHIPLGELPQRLAELRGHANVTFLCRTGVRSQAASALAVAAGLTQIGHLAGGIAGFQALPAPLQYSL